MLAIGHISDVGDVGYVLHNNEELADPTASFCFKGKVALLPTLYCVQWPAIPDAVLNRQSDIGLA